MPAYKIYKTAAEKNAAKKANYQRYYEKSASLSFCRSIELTIVHRHRESINKRRRSQYHNQNGDVHEMRYLSHSL